MESNEDTNKISNFPKNELKDEKKIEKSLNVSKTFNQLRGGADTEELIKDKIIKLRNNYNFSMSYSLSILNILKLFHKCLFEKVFNTLNENRSVFNVFKEISEFYQSFSEQVLKA